MRMFRPRRVTCTQHVYAMWCSRPSIKTAWSEHPERLGHRIKLTPRVVIGRVAVFKRTSEHEKQLPAAVGLVRCCGAVCDSVRAALPAAGCARACTYACAARCTDTCLPVPTTALSLHIGRHLLHYICCNKQPTISLHARCSLIQSVLLAPYHPHC